MRFLDCNGYLGEALDFVSILKLSQERIVSTFKTVAVLEIGVDGASRLFIRVFLSDIQ